MKTTYYFTTAITFVLSFLMVTQQSCKKKDETPAVSKNTFNDPRDGHTYRTITVGSHTWFAEDLDYDTPGSWKPSTKSGATGNIGGRYYLWETALNACPAGWHLASDGDWQALEISLGMSSSSADSLALRGTDEGKKLKSKSGWIGKNGTDDIDFTAFPNGFVIHPKDGQFELWDVGKSATYWTSTAFNDQIQYIRVLHSSTDKIERSVHGGNYYCVRCMK